MACEIYVVHEKLDLILERLAAIEALIRHEWRHVMSTLDDLAKQVEQNTSVENSAVQLIQGLAAQLAAAGTDPAKLATLQSQLQASAQSLAAAVAANTPAAPPAPPAPAPAG